MGVEALYERRTWIVRRVSFSGSLEGPAPADDDIRIFCDRAADPPALTTIFIAKELINIPPLALGVFAGPTSADWALLFLSDSPYSRVPPNLLAELWRAIMERDPLVLQLVAQALAPPAPSVKSILGDPRWKLRQRHSSAIIHAVAVANLHDRALDDVLLFAAFLAQADAGIKADTAAFTLETLIRQAGVDLAPQGMDESIPSLLKLDARGITTLRVSGSEPLSAAVENASADDAAFVLHVLEEAEAIRAKTGTEEHLDNRHFLAALLARPHRLAIGPYLDEQQFDVTSLRRELLDFIVEKHGESREAWRAALFVTSPFDVANRITSDVWTYDDSLGYRVYAKAIADAILKGSTTPPLTIGIQAPWGHGKTSLMRMIQAYLDPDSRTRNDDPALGGGLQTTLRDFLNFLDVKDPFVRAKAWFEHKVLGRELPKDPEPEGITDREKRIPTVWFNPLYYRERKQVWAGLAHAILHQLAHQLPSQRHREKFWLDLQLARIDVHAVRCDVQRFVLLRVLPVAALWLVAAAALAFLAPLLILSSGVLAAVCHALVKADKVLREQTVTGGFAKYVTEPNYAGELGLLHLVDHDLDLALRLLVGKRNIAVFIDDLDRCDPATVNEIVLAINHFLSVQNRKAFFFLGMDMAMVADALEEVHKKPATGNGRGFGWRFMEKFVQLPFVIPHLDREKAKQFAMDQLLGPKSPANEPAVDETIAILKRIESARTPAEIGHIARRAFRAPMAADQRARFEEAFSSRTTELMADPASDEIESIVKLAVADLELNPRTIKRYFCVVRVLRNIQIATGAAQSPDSDRKAILRTAHLLMNWPEFAQWLREQESFAEVEKAAASAKTHDAYTKALEKLYGKSAPPCVADASLYRFLSKIGNDGPSLSDLYAARLL